MLNIQKNLVNKVYLKIITSVHTLLSKITIRGYSKLSESESRVVKLGRSINCIEYHIINFLLSRNMMCHSHFQIVLIHLETSTPRMVDLKLSV